MAESTSTFTRASAGYERVMVPAVFAPWAKDLLETAALAPGMRVLDVACGTGIVARLVAPQVGPAGRVVGLDTNEAMLAVAKRSRSLLAQKSNGGSATRPSCRSLMKSLTGYCASTVCSICRIGPLRFGR